MFHTKGERKKTDSHKNQDFLFDNFKIGILFCKKIDFYFKFKPFILDFI